MHGDNDGEGNKPLPKQELLIKLMNMTTAAEDTVATVAIRKANELLKSAGWTWEKLIQGRITVVGDPFANIQAPKEQARQYARAPTPPHRPAGTATGRASGSGFQSQPSWNPRPQAAPQPPKPTVGSTVANNYAGPCYCCGKFVGSGLGFIFKAHQFNKQIRHQGWDIICADDNKRLNLVVSAKRAKAVAAKLSDLV